MKKKTCANCRFCIAYADGRLGKRHQCHAAPPVMMFGGHRGQIGGEGHVVVTEGTVLSTFFPIVDPANQTFFCGFFRGRGWLGALRRLVGKGI